VGNIGKEAQEIEVLPAEQAAPAEQAPAERESRPAEPAPPDLVPAAEPTPARA
jgi:hypothetical protein